MGKGLIPADPETWSVRRRQIVPAFHKVRINKDNYVINSWYFANRLEYYCIANIMTFRHGSSTWLDFSHTATGH